MHAMGSAKLLRLRLGAILSLIVVLVVIAANVALAVRTFNAYCMQERGEAIQTGLADPGFWQLVLTWLIITALPCLLVRKARSLMIFIGIASVFAAICLVCLPAAFDQPIECFTSGSSYPGNLFDLLAPATCIVVAIVFYAILIFDFLASYRAKLS